MIVKFSENIFENRYTLEWKCILMNLEGFILKEGFVLFVWGLLIRVLVEHAMYFHSIISCWMNEDICE